MKNLIRLLVIFFITAGPLAAQVSESPASDLHSKLKHRMESLLRAAGTGSELLNKEKDPSLWTYISWQDFLRLNKQAQERELVSVRLDNKAMELESQYYPNVPSFAFTNSAPDYSHAFTHKFIFIAEHITHNSAAAPQEVINILAAARKARPNAKILLAQEFLTWEGEKNTSLLKQAGHPSNLKSYYPQVSKAADRLGIDQLALDDSVFAGDEEQRLVSVKVGKYFITVKPSDKLPPLNIESCSWFYSRWAALEQLAGASPFGVLERNRQWAKRIKAVEKNYDLILVYAGNGHMNTTYFVDLPPLLGTGDYANINLFPFDEHAMEAVKEYEDLDARREEAKITDGQHISREKQKGYDKLPSETKQKVEEVTKTLPNWENSKLPLWLYITQEDFTAVNPGVQAPKELNGLIEGHCYYLVYLQEARVTPLQEQPKVCPVPIQISSPRTRSVAANPELPRSGNLFE